MRAARDKERVVIAYVKKIQRRPVVVSEWTSIRMPSFEGRVWCCAFRAKVPDDNLSIVGATNQDTVIAREHQMLNLIAAWDRQCSLDLAGRLAN